MGSASTTCSTTVQDLLREGGLPPVEDLQELEGRTFRFDGHWKEMWCGETHNLACQLVGTITALTVVSIDGVPAQLELSVSVQELYGRLLTGFFFRANVRRLYWQALVPSDSEFDDTEICGMITVLE